VWARRSGKQPYVLEHGQWSHGIDAEPVIEVLVAHAESAIAPTLAYGAGRWVVAWMEGDLARRGRVLLGSSHTSLGDAVAHAEVLSESGINARDPKVALPSAAGTDGWVVWSEFGAPQMALRYAKLTCP
jgi:hypothetical protein